MRNHEKEEVLLDERALIYSCQKGNKQAFDKLIREFYPYVNKFLLKTTGKADLCEDLTQETFLKMIRNIEKFDIDGSAGFGTWLITIAKNCYVDYLRREKHITVDLEDLELADQHSLESDVITKMEYQNIIKLINTLPAEQGIAIKLKYIENLTLAEIADYFGTKEKTIKSRIHDGTVKLRKLLNKE